MDRRTHTYGPAEAMRAIALVALLALTGVGLASAASLPVTAGPLTVATRTYGAAQTCTLTAVSDSYVNKAAPTTNSGTATSLILNADSTTTERSFVRFNLGSCSPAIPSDALVQSARVQLTVAVLALATRTYELRRATASWVETTVTWNLQPAVAGSPTASTTVNVGTIIGAVVEWTATSDVQAYVTGAATDLGWRVSDTNEGIFLGTPLTFNSREAGSGRPTLVVTYLP